jgi:peptidoglycan/xylan/chitin deacetylase (PgdA/CDA1 family)
MATRSPLAPAVAVLALLLGLAALWRLVNARDFQFFGRLVAEVDTRDSVVALSFDDGPTEGYTDTMIETLRARGVRATFFVTGKELAAAPAAGRRLVAAGHELGNHSYSHSRLVLKSMGRIREEVERTDSLIHAAGHAGPIHFRPPYGDKLVGLPWYLSRTGRTTVTWSVEPDSYADVAETPEGIVTHVLGRARPGAIIILHVWYDSRPASRAAVGPMIDSLHARGYRVVPVRELLGGGGARRAAVDR